jgi:hypothetical protein
MSGKRAGTGLVIVGAVVVVYFRFLRPWHLHWGATAQEAGGEVAGDELMPTGSSPNCSTSRSVMRSRCLAMRCASSGLTLGRRWSSAPATTPGCGRFELRPAGGHTRLISRNRFDTAVLPMKDKLVYPVIEPGSWVMERKMLLTIKQRAERLARTQPST